MSSFLLDDQICFPLYVASRRIQKRYRILLDTIGLTYPQYLVMLVLWEVPRISTEHLLERLHLDQESLETLLVRMEKRDLLKRTSFSGDGARVQVNLMESGRALREKAVEVPNEMLACLPPNLDLDLDLRELKRMLDQLVTLTQDM